MSRAKPMAHFDRCQNWRREYPTPAQRRRADRKLARMAGDRPSPEIRPELRAVTQPKGRPTPRRAEARVSALANRLQAEAARAERRRG